MPNSDLFGFPQRRSNGGLRPGVIRGRVGSRVEYTVADCMRVVVGAGEVGDHANYFADQRHNRADVFDVESLVGYMTTGEGRRLVGGLAMGGGAFYSSQR